MARPQAGIPGGGKDEEPSDADVQAEGLLDGCARSST